MIRKLWLLSLAVAAFMVAGSPPADADYELTAESPGCGYPRFYPPLAESSGSLSDSDYVRGPAGALFGRTIGAVKGRLVWWDVPMSDARFRVHQRLLPVLEDVEENLVAAEEAGLHYDISASESYGFSARTSIAYDAFSYHALGAAVDINPSSNPYRSDGVLVTDMPPWFVAAWEDAGMCWGGNWVFVKDAMHFSWVGPKGSPSYSDIPAPIPPLTSPSDFTTSLGRHDVLFGETSQPTFVIDASGDGVPDVAHLRPWGDDAVLELATSRGGFADCSLWRWWIEDPPEGNPYMADVDGLGRPDLVYLDTSGAEVVLRRLAVADGYRTREEIVTGVTPAPGRRYVFGDADGDGADDLWVVDEDDSGIEISIWSAGEGFTQEIGSGTLPGLLSADRLAVGDRTVDGRDELLLIEAQGASSAVHVVTGSAPGEVLEVIEGPVLEPGDTVGFEDYDGDGRPDLVVVSAAGLMDAYRGNTPLTGVAASSWFLSPDFDCPDDTVPYHHEGTFADDEESVFELDIEWLAVSGVTRGCNPPFQDRFCPDEPVTRAQMAAFLARFLDLAPGENDFTDDDGSVFEEDIGALAAAGVTRGCNPPVNDRFCPGDPVTRAQMAAFLTRALNLAPAANHFGDDDGSVFEEDIGALAAAGVTRGCNPPVNDRFCPGDPVTRGQMAAFLHRAAGLLPDS